MRHSSSLATGTPAEPGQGAGRGVAVSRAPQLHLIIAFVLPTSCNVDFLFLLQLHLECRQVENRFTGCLVCLPESIM